MNTRMRGSEWRRCLVKGNVEKDESEYIAPLTTYLYLHFIRSEIQTDNTNRVTVLLIRCGFEKEHAKYKLVKVVKEREFRCVCIVKQIDKGLRIRFIV